jgi:hypothetical protein
VRAPRLQQACFCDASLAAFAHSARLKLPKGDTAARAAWILREHADAWTRWKCSQITAFVRDARKALQAARPGALLGAFVVPWRPEERDGAIRTLLGQDFVHMARYLDVFSPMVYHRMVGRPAGWVAETAAYLRGTTKKPVWPIVQAVDAPPGENVSPEELAAILHDALVQSDGALLFTTQALAERPEKLAAVKEVFRARESPAHVK